MLAFRQPLSSPEHRRVVKDRRDVLRELGKCINGPRDGFVGKTGIVHGEVVAAGRCQRCLDIKRNSQ